MSQPGRHAIDLVALSGAGGLLLLYSHADTSLHTVSINQRAHTPPLASADAGERLSALAFSTDGSALLTAGDAGCVCLRRPSDLTRLQLLRPTSASASVSAAAAAAAAAAASRAAGSGPGLGVAPGLPSMASALRCLALTPDEQFVLAGTQRGTLLVWGLAREGERADEP